MSKYQGVYIVETDKTERAVKGLYKRTQGDEWFEADVNLHAIWKIMLASSVNRQARVDAIEAVRDNWICPHHEFR